MHQHLPHTHRSQSSLTSISACMLFSIFVQEHPAAGATAEASACLRGRGGLHRRQRQPRGVPRLRGRERRVPAARLLQGGNISGQHQQRLYQVLARRLVRNCPAAAEQGGPCQSRPPKHSAVDPGLCISRRSHYWQALLREQMWHQTRSGPEQSRELGAKVVVVNLVIESIGVAAHAGLNLREVDAADCSPAKPPAPPSS